MSSGSSGSSSGGPPPGCPPYPPQGACYTDEEGLECGYGNNGGGCGEQCACSGGEWSCYADPCPPPPPSCPGAPPPPGAACSGAGVCYYGEGCGSEQCICTGQYWECSGTSCPPPSCPAEPPGNESACNSEVGSLCDYPIENNVCSTWECDCYSGDLWNCYETNCYGGVDAGSGSSGGSSSSGGFGG
ncbi:MAG TPA: hypothetical protein VIJ22_19495 [Polyangiaceae bacterium]